MTLDDLTEEEVESLKEYIRYCYRLLSQVIGRIQSCEDENTRELLQAWLDSIVTKHKEKQNEIHMDD